MTKWLGLAALLLSCSWAVNAQEQEAKTKDSDQWHWDVQLAVGVVHKEHPLKVIKQDEFIDYLSVTVAFDVYYKGFFIQSNQRRSNPAEVDLGYEIINNPDWSLDFILKTYFEDILRDDLENTRLSHLNPRDESMGFALRYSKFFDEALVTLDVATVDFEDADNGWLFKGFYSHLIPYRNWEIYLGAGATYFSANVTNYYVGISDSEVRNNLAYYRPGASYALEAEAHAIYPLAEDWTLRMGITQTHFSKNINQSPMGVRANTTFLKLSFNYVF